MRCFCLAWLLIGVVLVGLLVPARHPAAVSAQSDDLFTPDDAWIAVLQALDTVEGLPSDPAAWRAEAWSAEDMTGGGITGMYADTWLARLNVVVMPNPTYDVMLVNQAAPSAWIGSVTSAGDVTGKWHNIETDLLEALPLSADGNGWQRVMLPLDPGPAERAGFFPALAAVLYRQGNIRITMWYGATPPYHAAVHDAAGQVTWYEWDGSGEPQPLNTSRIDTPATPDLQAIERVSGLTVAGEPTQVLRIFAAHTSECELPGTISVAVNRVDFVTGWIERDDCFELVQSFELILVLPAADGIPTINQQPIDRLPILADTDASVLPGG